MEEGWERPPRVELRLEELALLIEPAFPSQRVRRYAILTAGLANTSYRFEVEGESRGYVLRIHTRDSDAAGKELALMRLLAAQPAPRVPLAPLIYSDPEPRRGKHPYSIWGFVDGTLLQDLFRTLPARELVQIAAECGCVLAAIATHRFDRCGELGPALEIVHEYGRPSEFVPEMVHRALFEGRAGARLGHRLRDELWRVVEQTAPLLTRIDDGYALVHADYKRSNLLMRQDDRGWTVAAVLDWEFAFAGPPLIDVGLFLRAGDALPAGFREAFVSALAAAGGELPEEWLALSRLLDLTSQMTFLDEPRDRPRVFAETTAVVKETVRVLSRTL